MTVTMNDIAKRVRVSRATVSYVLSGRDDASISEATKRQVRAAAQEMGYRPNRMARALIKGRTQMIELLVHDFHPAFYSYMIHTVRKVIEQSEYHLNVAQVTAETSPLEASYWPVDGVLAFDCAAFVDKLPDSVVESVPIVSFGASYSTRVDHVGVDLAVGARAVLRHLIGIGRRRIAYLVAECDCQAGNARYDAYINCLKDAGFEPLFVNFNEDRTAYQRKAAREAVLERFSSPSGIDALFCFSDELAIGAHMALRQLGVSIPGDVALTGFDGIDDLECVDPPITAIAQPYEALAEIAWTFLNKRLENKDLPRQSTVLTPELVIRGSTSLASG
ncbi:MAG: LacI family DNA-binding transcriptional regulator [Capsulimonadaceae bacterium]|nr:LacI family DNA-binding transcriptional regulator [Capsulimonadaceae bacterium]